MNFDKPIEKEVIKQKPMISSGDNKFFNMETDAPELLTWMKEKGIEFDKGVIEVVNEEGRVYKMQTNKNDFGTFELSKDTEIIQS